MTPHRIQPAAGVLGSVRQVLALPPEPMPAPGVIGGLIALGAAFWNLHAVVLLLLVVAGGAVDLWTGSRRARIRQRLGLGEVYDRQILDEGKSGKVVALIITLFLGISIDVVASLLGSWGDLAIAGVFETYTPATAALLAWRWLREVSSIVDNVENTPGAKGSISPLVKRFIDTLRFRVANPGTTELPAERWDDFPLSQTEREWMRSQIEELRKKGAAPADG